MLTKRPKPEPRQISELDIKALEDGSIDSAIDDVRALYEKLGSNDQVAKGSELQAAVVREVASRVQHVPAR